MSCFPSILRLNVLFFIPLEAECPVFAALPALYYAFLFPARNSTARIPLWRIPLDGTLYSRPPLSFLARQRSLLRIRDLPLCLAAEIGIQHIPGFSNSLCRVCARLFTHANQRSVKGNDVSGFLIRDGSVLALRFRDVSASPLYKTYSSVLFFGLQETPVHL